MRGGPSAEREVSLRTGAAVAKALRARGHEVTEIDPKPRKWTLPAETDVVFLALHGTYGEDGAIQKELDSKGVVYTGCGPFSSYLAFNKLLAKQEFLRVGVRTPRHVLARSPNEELPRELKLPLVVKPLRQGSSVGLGFVNTPEQWPESLATALHHDCEALVEERIIGRETTVGILADAPLPVVEVRPRNGAYDYTNKYTAGATEYLCPAPFDEVTTNKIQEEALRAFRAVGARDYSRIDVMVDEGGKPWVLEVNTLPGMTETSLLPKAAAAAGISYEELCEKMVELALKRREETHVV